MSRKRKFCIDLTGRSEEEKERIMEKVQQVVDDMENESIEKEQELTEESESV